MFGLRRRSEAPLRHARGLGLVSLVIGGTEIAAPKQVSRLLGVDGPVTTDVLRTLGVREIAHGIDILTHRDDPTVGVWSRVAGDVLDGALLGIAATRTRNVAGFLTACMLVLPVVIADVMVAGELRRERAA